MSQEPLLRSTFPPLLCLLIVIPCQHHWLLTHALPFLWIILRSKKR